MDEYLDLVAEIQRKDPAQREGQAFYNAAHTLWPGLLADLPPDCDPFSLDRNLPAFLDWLEHARAGRDC
ncbi:hypothetical protein [Actinokineospora sp. HUAS TT18]|uniref:hypothetical protein n=1 Tax=Actinokineospora sp. HUAS TT18 TaxID=3447451 RepID=UPI003F5279EC